MNLVTFILFFVSHFMAKNTSDACCPDNQPFYRRIIDAFKKGKPTKNKEAHELYKALEPVAENIKITIQMLIGCFLAIAVLVDGGFFCRFP